MSLAELQQAFGGTLQGDARVGLEDVALDSRRARAGSLFAALPGTQDHGVRFLADAVRRGAAAVLMPHELGRRAAHLPPVEDLPRWLHDSPARTAGLAAARLAGDPSRQLQVAAITGTNGKTTTAHILGQLLDHGGLVPAVLGTAGHRLAGEGYVPATHTTPDAPGLQDLLARHLAAGGRSVAAEVSSHALMQERHAGLQVDVAIFTNLTPEHLDYHGDMQAYAAAKARLFESLEPGSHAVLHLDDPATPIMERAARAAGAQVHTYSVRQPADLSASKLTSEPRGTRFHVEGMGIPSMSLLVPLTGHFNVENALAAALAARLMGVSATSLLEALASTFPAPGRLEAVPNGRGIEAYVDYAHSPDALERVLTELRARLDAAGTGRLLVAFGCGGDRDRSKRGPMGACAARLADLAVVTNDNPRTEDPAAIAAAILQGARDAEPQRAELHVELDRRAALAYLAQAAQPGDVLLAAGKGHETSQTVGGQTLPFDDRVVLAEVLEDRQGEVKA